MIKLELTVLLNGFRESRAYVMSLSNIRYLGEEKIGDYIIDSYETY